MPKITGHKQAFILYSPKLRLQEFPTASWQFLIRSAANAARAFAVVHESGHVIGDVNHGNLFVGGNATVRLIDCDSYQITINGSRWFCEVGMPTHQPPELQNVRTYKRSCELQTTTILGSPSSSFKCSSWRGIHFRVDSSVPVKCPWSEQSANIGSPMARMLLPCRCNLHRQVLVSMASPETWRSCSSERSPNRAPSQMVDHAQRMGEGT